MSYPQVKPFKALHYHPSLLKFLDRLTCPPYDVITLDDLKILRAKSPYNFSHILLKDKEEDYRELARKFKNWLRNSILVEDEKECFYLCEQEFSLGLRRYVRRGLIGLLRVDKIKTVFPHEHTHSKPKKDRLRILTQIKANLSPIFVVYPPEKKKIISLTLKGLSSQEPFIDFLGADGVRYRIWRVEEDVLIKKIQSYFKDKPFLIADGHHRFEVAYTFWKNKRGTQKFKDLNYIITYFTPQDSNLFIFPTHRLLKKDINIDKFQDKAKDFFKVRIHKSYQELSRYIENKKVFSFGTYQKGNFLSFSLKRGDILSNIFRSFSETLYKNLETFLLHRLVFENILKLKLKENELDYFVDPQEVIQAVDEGNKGVAFFLRATKIKDVLEIALKGYRLPQKSTYFYPKFLSGLLLRRL